jgi:hypothetical protein
MTTKTKLRSIAKGLALSILYPALTYVAGERILNQNV